MRGSLRAVTKEDMAAGGGGDNIGEDACPSVALRESEDDATAALWWTAAATTRSACRRSVGMKRMRRTMTMAPSSVRIRYQSSTNDGGDTVGAVEVPETMVGATRSAILYVPDGGRAIDYRYFRPHELVGKREHRDREVAGISPALRSLECFSSVLHSLWFSPHAI